jgi:hypothetical protein
MFWRRAEGPSLQMSAFAGGAARKEMCVCALDARVAGKKGMDLKFEV